MQTGSATCLVRQLILMAALFIASVPVLAGTPDRLPAFVMPKIAPWPAQEQQTSIPSPKELPALIRKAAAGDANAHFQLARYYGHKDKKGLARNQERADQHLAIAAQNGHPAAIYYQAWAQASMNSSCFYDGLDDNAIKLMEKSARAGYGPAAYALARHYRKNIQSSNKDMASAVYWYRKAVENHYALAAYELGELYFPVDASVFEVPPDIVTAYVWRVIAQTAFENTRPRSRNVQLPIADTNLDMLAYLQLHMLPSEKKRADDIITAWPEKLPPHVPTGPVFRKNTDKYSVLLSKSEYETLKKRSEAGDAIATHELVSAYYAGRIPREESATIITFLKKAADQDVGEAKNLLAWNHIFGKGVDKNEEKGFAMLRAHAAQGDTQAYYYLGLAIKESRRDINQARKWFEKGAQAGNVHCMVMLGILEKEKPHGIIARQQAKQWYEKAARLGSDMALIQLLDDAESAKNIPEITKWASIIILRTEDPLIAYKSRLLISEYASDELPETREKAMKEAEKWHKENPPPSVRKKNRNKA